MKMEDDDLIEKEKELEEEFYEAEEVVQDICKMATKVVQGFFDQG